MVSDFMFISSIKYFSLFVSKLLRKFYPSLSSKFIHLVFMAQTIGVLATMIEISSPAISQFSYLTFTLEYNSM